MATRGQLPAYFIDNAMVNFQPLASAIDGYREGMGVAGKSVAQINAANAMQAGDFERAASETARSGDVSGAMSLRRHPGEMRAQEDAARARETQMMAGRAQSLLGITDPTQRRAEADRWFASDPRFAAARAARGGDPNDVDGFLGDIVAEARGYRDPSETALREAQTRKANAEAANAGLLVAPAGSTVIDRSTRQPVLTTERPLTADDRRTIRTAEDDRTNLSATRSVLERALELNNAAFTGVTARARGFIGSSVPGGDYLVDRGGANATRELDQILSLESVKAMSATLKGATTNRELFEFQRILSDPTSPPDLRRRTIERMMQLADAQLADASNRATQIREGTYYRPGGGQTSPNPPSGNSRSGTSAAPVLVDTPEAAAQLPPGTYFRGTDGILRMRPLR